MKKPSFWTSHVLPYFIFSKGERRGIILLLILIMLTAVIPLLLPKEKIPLQAEEIRLIDSMNQEADEALRMRNEEYSRKRLTENYPGRKRGSSPMQDRLGPVRLQKAFDPNTASEEIWMATGLPERTIRTIQHYLKKGGRFRRPEDLRKIYGFPEDAYSGILPYIQISSGGGGEGQAGSRTGMATPGGWREQGGPGFRKSGGEPFRKRTSETASLDINLADSAQWEALPGIGPSLARRIVLFRNRLGGFDSPQQVGEVYGLPDSVFRKILPRLVRNLEMAPVHLQVNSASVETLSAHPYVSMKLAQLIVAYRNQHGNFRQADDLLNIPLMTAELLQKLQPYLDFN